VILGIVVAIPIVRRQVQEKSDSQRQSNRAFDAAVERSRLSSHEVDVVHRLVKHDLEADASLIFRSVVQFEKCIHAEIESVLAANPDRDELTEIEMLLSSIRRKVGFHMLPLELPLASTRNVSTGQTGTIFGASTRKPLVQKVTVVKNNEISFRVQYDVQAEDAVKLSPGVRLRFAFTRQEDGFYGVSVPVIAFSSQQGVIELGHTIEIKRNQMRQHVRVPTNLPLRFRLTRTTDPDKSEVAVGVLTDARMSDISGGGMSFTHANQLRPGDMVSLNFGLSGSTFAGVVGTVIRVGLQKKEKVPTFKHHIRFETLSNDKRDKIVKYVFEKLRVLSSWR